MTSFFGTKAFGFALMHGLNHAGQSWVGGRVIKQIADANFEQGRGEPHPIVGLSHLRRHCHDQRILRELRQRVSIRSRKVGKRRGANLVPRTVCEERIAGIAHGGRPQRHRVGRIDGIKDNRANYLGMQRC